jgi:hypothetical protein
MLQTLATLVPTSKKYRPLILLIISGGANVTNTISDNFQKVCVCLKYCHYQRLIYPIYISKCSPIPKLRNPIHGILMNSRNIRYNLLTPTTHYPPSQLWQAQPYQKLLAQIYQVQPRSVYPPRVL